MDVRIHALILLLRYYQNINFQQVLPEAFAKSLKRKETVTRVCLCLLSSNACSKKSKLLLTDHKKHEPSNPMRISQFFFLWELKNYTSLRYYIQEIDVLKISNSYNLSLDIISDC